MYELIISFYKLSNYLLLFTQSCKRVNPLLSISSMAKDFVFSAKCWQFLEYNTKHKPTNNMCVHSRAVTKSSKKLII